MKRSTKAALWSALVFPGAGHFYLRRWVEGLVLAAVALVAVYVIASVIGQVAIQLTGEIERGVVAGDIATIAVLAEQRLQATQAQTHLATLALLASWVLGVIGAYWQGRRAETADGQR